MLKALLATILILPLFLFAQERIGSSEHFHVRPGIFLDGRIELTITQQKYNETLWYEFMADGVGSPEQDFLHFYFNPVTAEVSETPWRKGPGKTTAGHHIEDGQFELVTSFRNSNGNAVFEYTRGGFLQMYDQKLQLILNTNTGHVVRLSTKSKRARYTLPNGYHSGPFKEVIANFDCQNFLESENGQ